MCSYLKFFTYKFVWSHDDKFQVNYLWAVIDHESLASTVAKYNYIIDGQGLMIQDDDDHSDLVIRIILDGYDYNDYNLAIMIDDQLMRSQRQADCRTMNQSRKPNYHTNQ